MAAHAYYDQTLTTAAAKAQLTSLSAKALPARSKGDAKVYAIRGGGEAMVESAGAGKVRVRLYAGKCPC